MSVFIPIFTALAGLAAAFAILLVGRGGDDRGTGGAVAPDPEAADERRTRLLAGRGLAFLVLVMTTLVCLTIQLGILVGGRTSESGESKPASEETAQPNPAPDQPGSGESAVRSGGGE